MLVTLSAVYVLRRTEPDPGVAQAKPSATVDDEPEPIGSARARFAQLYTEYLLRTYYVPRRGFCKPLMKRICKSLLDSHLLRSRLSCEALPNDRFILGIGRFQHKSGLPVDGKAGPETVRLMLGGNFNSRKGMAALYCPRGAFSDDGIETEP